MLCISQFVSFSPPNYVCTCVCACYSVPLHCSVAQSDSTLHLPPPPTCACCTGPDPTVGAFLAGRRQTIVGIPPTPEQLQHLSHLAEQAQQQGGGGTEGGREVDGSASGLGATPNMIVQNESMHPQPLHHRPPREFDEA